MPFIKSAIIFINKCTVCNLNNINSAYICNILLHIFSLSSHRYNINITYIFLTFMKHAYFVRRTLFVKIFLDISKHNVSIVNLIKIERVTFLLFTLIFQISVRLFTFHLHLTLFYFLIHNSNNKKNAFLNYIASQVYFHLNRNIHISL